MRKKKLLIMSFLAMSVMGLTGCGVMNSVTAPLEQFMNKSQDDETALNDFDVGEEDEAPESDIFGDVIEEETVPEEETEETSFNFDDRESKRIVFDDYYTTTSSTGDEAGSEDESTSKPMYSAEYYFKQISNMELPEGATADEDGNIHYNGYRLLKCNRDMLPSTAVVGAEINYEIYVTTLPDGEKSSSRYAVNDDDDADDENGVVEDETYKRRIEPVEESMNRVRNAVEEAAKIKNNAEADSYDAINQAATESMGKTVDTNIQETTPFVPTTPDEDPEYEGKLVSIDRRSINGPQA